MAGQVIITADEATARYVEQLVARLDEAGIPCLTYDHTDDAAVNEQMRESVKTCVAVVAVMFEEPASSVAAVSLAAFEHDKPIFPLRLGGQLYAWLSDPPTEDVRDFRMPSASWVDRLRRLSAGEASVAEASVNRVARTGSVTIRGGRSPAIVFADMCIAVGPGLGAFVVVGFLTQIAGGGPSVVSAWASVAGVGAFVAMLVRDWWMARKTLTISGAGLCYGRNNYPWSMFSHMDFAFDRFVAIVEPDPITGTWPSLPGRYRARYPGYVVALTERLHTDPFEVMITVDRFDPARDHWRFVA